MNENSLSLKKRVQDCDKEIAALLEKRVAREIRAEEEKKALEEKIYASELAKEDLKLLLVSEASVIQKERGKIVQLKSSLEEAHTRERESWIHVDTKKVWEEEKGELVREIAALESHVESMEKIGREREILFASERERLRSMYDEECKLVNVRLTAAQDYLDIFLKERKDMGGDQDNRKELVEYCTNKLTKYLEQVLALKEKVGSFSCL